MMFFVIFIAGYYQLKPSRERSVAHGYDPLDKGGVYTRIISEENAYLANDRL